MTPAGDSGRLNKKQVTSTVRQALNVDLYAVHNDGRE
ncbi:hypothetical protein H4W80_004496 [Nonomuraea angiospora]|uniref:Uncharacterized protein n=1 Tax=Nonomuraea angiospora TaxID=46172 RepID=A0ABR9M020_9ACTN|nr:hypothetical protein [Nonomuraea angiospora]